MEGSKQSPALFIIRPLFAAALGLCLGTGLFSIFETAAHSSLLLFLFGFSMLLLLLRRRLGALFVLSLAAGLLRSGFPPLSLPSAITGTFSGFADIIGGRIDLLFPDPAGAARGMLLGARNAALDEVLSNRLYHVGIGHLLAVSGLHVGILGGAISLVWRCSFLRLRYTVQCLFLLLYILLTGGAPSVIRASVMLLAATPVGLSLRRRDPLSSLSLACCIIVLLDPTAPASVGFQLSFLAVLGLQLLSAPLTKHVSFLGKTMASALSASMAATIGTLPVMCLAFSEISVFGLTANLLVVPLAAFFLVPALLCTALSFPFPALANAICVVPRFLLDVMMTLASAGGSTVLRVSAPTAPSMLLYYAALFLFSPHCMRAQRKRLLYGSICMAAAILLWRI